MTHTSLVQPRIFLSYLDQKFVVVADIPTGEYDTAKETKYVSIKETLVGNTLKCKQLNERLWTYDMVDCLDILILRDTNALHAKFIWGG